MRCGSGPGAHSPSAGGRDADADDDGAGRGLLHARRGRQLGGAGPGGAADRVQARLLPQAGARLPGGGAGLSLRWRRRLWWRRLRALMFAAGGAQRHAPCGAAGRPAPAPAPGAALTAPPGALRETGGEPGPRRAPPVRPSRHTGPPSPPLPLYKGILISGFSVGNPTPPCRDRCGDTPTPHGRDLTGTPPVGIFIARVLRRITLTPQGNPHPKDILGMPHLTGDPHQWPPPSKGPTPSPYPVKVPGWAPIPWK